MKKALFAAALLVIAAIGSVPALAQSTNPPPLDHFRCYYIPNQIAFTPNIQLQDQFDAAVSSTTFEHIAQLTLARICNTTQKLINNVTTPMTNPNHHLAMYQLSPQPITPRIVVVTNQFTPSTGQTLMVSDARFLLVPSGKIPLPGTQPDPSPDLDHYKCYAAGGPQLNVLPFLTDEFITERTFVLWPVLFCNPTVKIHTNVTTNIQNNRDHLTCYATVGTGFAGIVNPPGVGIRNQFGTVGVPVMQPDMFCVPSIKVSWSVVVPPPSTSSSATKTAKPAGGNLM
ncbi:MAG TPA: hypothetical protein VKY85_24980 [Candidatus Angelobacter sp.]|nr:hypothetical protein [Candidatus Angelobacter sp.]